MTELPYQPWTTSESLLFECVITKMGKPSLFGVFCPLWMNPNIADARCTYKEQKEEQYDWKIVARTEWKMQSGR